MGYISNFKDGLDTLEAEYNKLEKKYNDLVNDNKPKALIPYTSVNFYKINQFRTKSNIETHFKYVRTEEAINEVKDKILALCVQATNDFNLIKAQNVAIIEYNKKVVASAKQYMSSLGIPESRSERDYKSRSRYPKSKTVAAGYLDDLYRYIPTYDSASIYLGYCTSIAADVTKYAEEAIKSIKDLEAIKQAEEKEKKKNFLVTKMIIKYELPDTSSVSDVFWHIVNKDKYLRLAHYMSLNRGDWSDGCDYTETGLAGFSTNSEQDLAIFNEIGDLCNNWDGDGDGRVFRDCEWNYSRIFELADKDLYKDYSDLYNMENFQ